jgi:hypothetical protein
MRKAVWPAGTAGLLLLLAARPAPAQETPRTLIERAITAHGGSERLSRVRAEKVRLQGTVIMPGKNGPLTATFTADQAVQLPGQFKYVAQLNTDQKHTIVQVLNGDKAFVKIDGQPQEKPEPVALARLRESLRLIRVTQLVPLLNDPVYELSALGETKVNGRVSLGVKVKVRGKKDIRLYFDHETGLLTKTEQVLDEGNGKEVLQEQFYGDFKEFAGYRRWTKTVVLRDGKTLLEAEVRDVKYFDKLDESEFATP